jgi:hypothetical protein
MKRILLVFGKVVFLAFCLGFVLGLIADSFYHQYSCNQAIESILELERELDHIAPLPKSKLRTIT